MTHPELPTDVTGSDPKLGKFYNSHSDVVRKGAPVHKNSAELVDFSIGIHMRL